MDPDKLREAYANANSADYAGAFIEALRSGESCDVATLDRPAVDAKAKLNEAEHRVSVWAKTRAACDLAVIERLKAAGFQAMM